MNTKWDKKEPIPCWNCMNPACAENGDHHWYCFRCFMNMDIDLDEVEVDESLQVCESQLAIQSEAY